MTKEKLLETILKTSYAKVDMHRRIRMWRTYLETEFFAAKKPASIAVYLEKEKVAAEDKKAILSWGEDFYSTFTKDNAYEITDALTDAIKNLPLVNLYIPFEPPAKDLDAYGAWFRENVDKYMLVEVHVDASTFGGCAFAVDGNYHDFSLRNRLEALTPQIHEILGKYVA